MAFSRSGSRPDEATFGTGKTMPTHPRFSAPQAYSFWPRQPFTSASPAHHAYESKALKMLANSACPEPPRCLVSDGNSEEIHAF
ncbi:MAG: hypothetical protein B7Y73_01805 [Acidocella sp. 35-58-6]|nr:MAG: hypothetical protein B7Y73_01805 [Acidocella sp. 35-58-6]